MRKFCIALLLSCMCLQATSSENKSMQDLMLVSKVAGVCGVMQQMAQFQSSTKMPGGAEFTERFWKTEFARLGKTQAQFFKECEESIAIYNQLWEASNIRK